MRNFNETSRIWTKNTQILTEIAKFIAQIVKFKQKRQIALNIEKHEKINLAAYA